MWIRGMCVSVSPAVRRAAQRGLCVSAAGAVAGRGVEQGGPRGAGGGVRGFQEIPHTGSSGWLNLLRFWREDSFTQLHKHMERTFNTLGPIYRVQVCFEFSACVVFSMCMVERLGTQSSVNILLPADISELFHSEGLHPRRMTLQPWATHREIRQHSKGGGDDERGRETLPTPAGRGGQGLCRLLQTRVEREGAGPEGQRSLTFDPSPDLFRFALEASCHVLYGERIGLFSSSPSQESQRFIWAVERMLATTPPLLYLPPRLLLRVGAPLWTDHATAWDHIFSHAEARIQRGYQRLQSSSREGGGAGGGGAGGGEEGRFSGVLSQLMEKGQLSLELIRANITELMAGGVDTTAVPLQFGLYELGRNPEVQERVRQQVRAAWAQADGHVHKALQGAPLLKGTVKEILRLYPVGITVQRYPIRDIVLQNYHIPAGTLVQACLYPLGRSGKVFQDPKRFDPGRWGRAAEGGGASTQGGGGGTAFRSLAFGFGARQCVGRRIAENEMQLVLMHILLNFRLSVSSSEDIKTKYTLILQPETTPRITFSTL
ncbi:cytochrome P450 11C1 [Osmerus mordax]|uniref:cytochrome P450 11C1 n=1 Tax=Osmerus mordax TaxID=8014 RepID=UPI00350F24A8